MSNSMTTVGSDDAPKEGILGTSSNSKTWRSWARGFGAVGVAIPTLPLITLCRLGTMYLSQGFTI